MSKASASEVLHKYQCSIDWKERTASMLKAAQRFGDTVSALSLEGDAITEELLKLQRLSVAAPSSGPVLPPTSGRSSPLPGATPSHEPESTSEETQTQPDNDLKLMEGSIMGLRQMVKSFVVLQRQMLQVLVENFDSSATASLDHSVSSVAELKKKFDKARQDYAETATRTQETFIKKAKNMDEATFTALTQELEHLNRVSESSCAGLDQELATLNAARQQKLMKFITSLTTSLHNFFQQGLGGISLITPQLETISRKMEDDERSSFESGVKEGWLMKRGGSSTWHKYFFTLRGGVLQYQRGSPDDMRSFNIMLCSVRARQGPGSTPLEFEIATPSKSKPIILHAETENERQQWVSAIQRAVSSTLSSQSVAEPKASMSPELRHSIGMHMAPSPDRKGSLGTGGGDVMSVLRRVPGNLVCADCDCKDPSWASISLGITLCLECSGVHRGMGTHVSKVRSATLDRWDPETIIFMQAVGNQKASLFFEVNGITMPRPQAKSDRDMREKFIHAKYVAKDFASKEYFLTPPSILSRRLMDQVREHNPVHKLLEMVLSGADPNWAEPETAVTPLMAAAQTNYLVCVEMLLSNGADITLQDTRGFTALHYAAMHNHLQMVSLLLRRKGIHPIYSAVNNDLQTPLALAEAANSLDVLALLKSYGQVVSGEDPSIADAVLFSFRSSPTSAAHQDDPKHTLDQIGDPPPASSPCLSLGAPLPLP
eukprot:TRINITY_DN5320_c0_g1_i5.p1 TRINITY_DN5320_c0_g1~~TRINITY_DN5320_c0_g1_i5.p1  ORF type:complete len:715 (-),score=168.19 TRINITY_DN5320_c0_g1_i5:91-2235(-)